MRRSRRIGLVLLILIVLLATLIIAGRRYLASRHMAARVAERLQAIYGAPVQVGELDVGTSSSSVHDLKLFEAGADDGTKPWAVIRDVQTDVSAWDLLRGEAVPQHLTLIGADVTLRFDKSGRLLTRLPVQKGTGGKLPQVQIEQGQVTLIQEGHPDLAISGVTAELEQEGDQVRLHGSVSNPSWGSWSIEGELNRQDSSAQATLKSAERLHVTQTMLKALPFVPATVWEQVQLEGDTTAEVTVRAEPGSGAIHYHAVLDPIASHVHVASIDVTADPVHGHVVIEDGIVRLRDVQGRVAEGELTTSGDLDFSKEPSQLHFRIHARDLNVHDLPASWHLPENLHGKLTGEADLHVTIRDGEVETSGQGEGVINQARIGRFQPEPIHLQLGASKDGFHFQRKQPQTRRSGGPSLLSMILLAMPRPAGAESAKSRPVKLPTYLDATLDLKDVDIKKLLEELELKLPFPVDGRLSIRVQLSIPVKTPGDPKTYRMKGQATLPQLRLGGLELVDVHAQASYTDGILTLDELHGRVPVAAGAAAGSFSGNARLELLPAGDLRADLALERIPLARRLSLVPGAAEGAGGTFSGKIKAHAPAARLDEIGTWEASGSIQSDRAQAYGLTLGDANADIRLKGGVLTARKVQAKIEGWPLSGSGELHLVDRYRYQARIEVRKADPAGLQRLASGLLPPFAVAGRIDLTADVNGTLRPLPGSGRQFTADTDLAAPRLLIQGIPAERLHARINYRNANVTYHLEGDTLGGRVQLDGRIAPAESKPAPPGEGRLLVQGVQLSRLWQALPMQSTLGPLRGTLDLDLRYRHEGPDWVPVGKGPIVLRGLRWDETDLTGSVRGEASFMGQELRFQELTGTLGQGELSGQVGINLKERERSGFNLSLQGAEASRLLLPWPGLAGRIQGPLTLHLRGTLGRVWHGDGDATLTRGSVLGVEVAEWRLPFDFAAAPAHGTGRLDLRDSVAQIAYGRVVGRASYHWDFDNRLEGNLRFYNLDVRTLLRQASGELSQAGAGQLTGQFTFSGSNVHTLTDLTGNLEARLGPTQALQLPVLSQLVPFLRGGQASATFNSGSLRAFLGGGVFRIERLALLGPVLQLFIEGTITLEGRLNLGVVASTNLVGLTLTPLRLIGVRLANSGPMSTGLRREASTFLSPRVTHLRATGTARNPSVRIESTGLLTEGAIRFFVGVVTLPLSY